MFLRVGDESVRVNSDRITRAPSTAVDVLNEDPNVAQTSSGPDESDEYVVERVVDHTHGPNRESLFRVRWYEFDEEDDTWEQEEKIPRQFIRRYWRSKNTTARHPVTNSMNPTPWYSPPATRKASRTLPPGASAIAPHREQNLNLHG
jgi:hypothetical protein